LEWLGYIVKNDSARTVMRREKNRKTWIKVDG